jgi:phosphoribosylaminoimidazole-succinocarboxamide synthase
MEIYFISEIIKKKMLVEIVDPILDKKSPVRKSLMIKLTVILMIYIFGSAILYLGRKNWQNNPKNYFDFIVNCKSVLKTHLNFAAKDFG